MLAVVVFTGEEVAPLGKSVQTLLFATVTDAHVSLWFRFFGNLLDECEQAQLSMY